MCSVSVHLRDFFVGRSSCISSHYRTRSLIVEEFSLLCCTSMAHAEILRYGAKIISAHAKKCSMLEASVAEGRREGQKSSLNRTLGA